MNVLVACEESQAVCKAFRALGHTAYSCDLQPCSGGHPEWHIIADAVQVANIEKRVYMSESNIPVFLPKRWDLIIAHPPCTYMSKAGACRMYPTKGNIDMNRYKKAMEAKKLFLAFLQADCDKIVVENPMPLKCVGLPIETQRIQPYEYGEPYSKKTYLWIKGLPKLQPTKILDSWKPFLPSCTGRKLRGDSYGVAQTAKARSKTFPGIARAMAEQWGGVAHGV